MFKKILVPIDLGGGHESAVDLAISLLSPEGGHITLVHAIEVIAGLSRDDDPAFYRRLEQAADHHLAQYLTRNGASHIASQRVIYGDRAAEILRLAEDSATDLIVLRSHRIDPREPAAGWATLSHKIAALASCPVLLVKSARPSKEAVSHTPA